MFLSIRTAKATEIKIILKEHNSKFNFFISFTLSNTVQRYGSTILVRNQCLF